MPSNSNSGRLGRRREDGNLVIIGSVLGLCIILAVSRYPINIMIHPSLYALFVVLIVVNESSK